MNQPVQQKPAEYYLEWKSKQNCFTFWHTQQKLNKTKALPYRVQIIAYRYTLKGYDKGHGAALYSNEVKSLKEPFLLKRFPNKKIGEQHSTTIEIVDNYLEWKKVKRTANLYAVLYVVDEYNITNALLFTGKAFGYIKAYRQKQRPDFEGVCLQSVVEQTAYGNNYYVDFVPDPGHNNQFINVQTESQRLESLWLEYYNKSMNAINYHRQSLGNKSRDVGVPPSVQESPIPKNPPVKPDNPF